MERVPDFAEVSGKLEDADRLAAGCRPRPHTGRSILRTSRRSPFSRDELAEAHGRARLHRRARHVPRLLRPRADPQPAYLCRLHADLRAHGARRHRFGRRRDDHPALLVHGRIRPHPGEGPAAQGVRRGTDVVLQRAAVRRRKRRGQPRADGHRDDHAHGIRDRQLPARLFRPAVLRGPGRGNGRGRHSRHHRAPQGRVRRSIRRSCGGTEANGAGRGRFGRLRRSAGFPCLHDMS